MSVEELMKRLTALTVEKPETKEWSVIILAESCHVGEYRTVRGYEQSIYEPNILVNCDKCLLLD